MPYTEDPAELAGADVAIVGAPTDDLVSDRPGARFGPRAIRAASCPPGPHLEAKIDGFAALRVVDFGDAPVLPADPAASHAAIERTVGQVLAAGAIPIVLGGDHGIAEPDIRACAGRHGGPVGLVHFDTHTDTGEEVFGVEVSHGTPMRRLVEQGHVDPRRYAQVGLRGYWPGEEEFSLAGRARDHEPLHARRPRARDRRGGRARRGGGGGGAGLPLGRHRRPRPGLRARHRHAGARRDDQRRAAARLPPAGRAAGAGRRRGGRGDPDRRRLGRHHGAGRPTASSARSSPASPCAGARRSRRREAARPGRRRARRRSRAPRSRAST